MNKFVIGLGGFVTVMGVGAIIVASSDKSDEEIAADVMLRAGTQLTRHAIGRCQSKIQKELGRSVYSPKNTEGDHATIVTLTWEGDKDDFKSATCTYLRDKGIVSLKIDDKVLVERK